MKLDHHAAPYLDALLAYAAQDPGRLHIPGHKGGPGAAPALREAIGSQALALDIPALTHGVDSGPGPTPFDRAQALAADAWGARRAWFLVNGASQGNLAAGLAVAHHGSKVVVQRNVHSSTVDAMVLSGMRPTFAQPEIDPELGIAHCLLPSTLERALAQTPDAVAAWIISPTYFGAAADVRSLVAVAHAANVPLIVDEAWGAHLAFHEALPPHALSLGADLVISSTHKIIGSLGQSAMLHLGPESRFDEDVVDRAVTLVESTSPSSLLLGSLDAARRHAALNGRELLAQTMQALELARAEIREIPGLDVLDERLVGRSGVFDYDPLRLAVDVRGIGVDGYALATLLRELDQINLELAGSHAIVAVFGIGARAAQEARRLTQALRLAVERVGLASGEQSASFVEAPPWGELALSPREAYLGAQEVVSARDAVGRIAAEALAAYPPGIPNVLPGERLTAETLDYIQAMLRAGGSLRGASDRELRTIRVVTQD